MSANRVRTVVLIFLVLCLAGPSLVHAQRSGGQKLPTPGPTAPPEPTATPKPTVDSTVVAAEKALRHLVAWRHEEARALLEPLRQAPGAGKVEFKTAWALLLAEEGELDQALDLLDAAANKDKTAALPVYFKGEVLFWKKDYEAAKAAWGQANDRATAWLETHPDDSISRFYQGAARVRQLAGNQARQSLSAAREAGHDQVPVEYQVGLSHFADQQWQAAVDTLTEAVENDSGFAHAYYYRALAWKRLDRTDKMMNDLDRFLRLAPNAPEAGSARTLVAAGK